MSSIYICLLFIFILLLLIFISNLYSKKLLYNIEFFDIYQLSKNYNKNNSNISSKSFKNIIIGFDKNNLPIEEEIIVNNYCAGENQSCLIDSNGVSTCCNNLKCIREKDNFHNYICSYNDKTACGYNTFLCEFNILFEDLWQKWIDKIKSGFKINWDDNYLKNLKLKLEKELSSLCASDKMSNQEKTEIIQAQLNKIILDDLVFAKPVNTIKLN